MTASSVSENSPAEDSRRAATPGGAMLYDPSRAGNATPDLFERDNWEARGSLQSAARGRGQAYYVADGTRSWVLRHYRRGGWVARLMGDRYLWTGERRARPFREWLLLREMHAAGLPVPAPVAARYQRSGAMYRGDLITERLVGARALSELLTVASVTTAIWVAIGACIRRFHQQGYCHPDLNAHNVLIDDQGRVYLIDFDRGRRRPPGRWEQANLARLRRSLDKIALALPADRVPAASWKVLLLAYGSGSHASNGPASGQGPGGVAR